MYAKLGWYRLKQQDFIVYMECNIGWQENDNSICIKICTNPSSIKYLSLKVSLTLPMLIF